MWERVARLARAEYSVSDCDLVAMPGAAKKICDESTRADTLASLAIAANLHGVTTIALVHHEDCGAYGGAKAFPDASAERYFHEDVLRSAATIVRAHLPQVKVETFYAHFLPDGSDITLDRVVEG